MISNTLTIVVGAAAAAAIITGAAVVNLQSSSDRIAATGDTEFVDPTLRTTPGRPRPGHTQGGQNPRPTPTYVPHRSNGSEDGSGKPKTRTNLRRQDRVKNGNYETVIAGHYSGSGIAEVKDDRVSLKARVTNPDGATGELLASNMTVLGPYFFGPGTLMGQTVHVSGRVDAPRASRLVANFVVADGYSGRMVGRLPSSVDPGNDDWIGDSQPIRQGE